MPARETSVSIETRPPLSRMVPTTASTWRRGAGQAIARDTRRNFRPFVASGQQPCRLNPGIRFTAIAELAPVSTVLQVAGITTSQQWFRPCVPFIIAPGSRFVIETSVVASALQVNLHWREVTMLPQSL